MGLARGHHHRGSRRQEPYGSWDPVPDKAPVSTIGSRAKDHVTGVAALLSVVSVALVFAAAGGVLPANALPESSALVAAVPHLNAAISVAAIAAIAGGVRAIRRGDVDRHRSLMATAFVLFVAFLALYLYKIVIAGPSEFGGPDPVYRFVYLPVLAIHVLLAVVTIPPLYYVLGVGLTHPVEEIPRTRHPRLGRVAATLWTVSFALGIVVYLLLYVVYP